MIPPGSLPAFHFLAPGTGSPHSPFLLPPGLLGIRESFWPTHIAQMATLILRSESTIYPYSSALGLPLGPYVDLPEMPSLPRESLPSSFVYLAQPSNRTPQLINVWLPLNSEATWMRRDNLLELLGKGKQTGFRYP